MAPSDTAEEITPQSGQTDRSSSGVFPSAQRETSISPEMFNHRVPVHTAIVRSPLSNHAVTARYGSGLGWFLSEGMWRFMLG
jgi:hypothetical protein